MEISIVIPCKNEQEGIGICIDKIKKTRPDAEIIVVDNNSTDKSAEIARKKGAKVVKETTPGYGAALRKGFKTAKGKYVIMADADDTYDFREIKTLLKYKEYDMVLGNRKNKKMKKGSMPFLHRFVGTPALSKMLRTIFKTKIKDSQSGFRLIKKEALDAMNLQSNGMELASEMIIKATKLKLKVKETPITYHPRKGDSKLNTFNDGWRHLKLILIYGPNYLFLMPGLLLFTLGILLTTTLTFTNINILGITLQEHPQIIGSIITILGFNIITLWSFTKIYEKEHLNEKNKFSEIIKKTNLEKILITGLIPIIISLIIFVNILITWINANFGELQQIRTAILALTLLILGTQIIFSGFFISVLQTKKE